jgi:excisionase family DNA binding protein
MEEFLTVQEMAMILKLSKVYVHKLVRLQKIPFYRINKAVRFHPDEIREWLASKKMVAWHPNRP